VPSPIFAGLPLPADVVLYAVQLSKSSRAQLLNVFKIYFQNLSSKRSFNTNSFLFIVHLEVLFGLLASSVGGGFVGGKKESFLVVQKNAKRAMGQSVRTGFHPVCYPQKRSGGVLPDL
jgi:hypothetical protein